MPGAGELITNSLNSVPPSVMSPLTNAASTVTSLLPGMGGGVPEGAASAATLGPTIDLPNVPGLPIGLPETLTFPTDLICVGPWALPRDGGATPAADVDVAATPPAERRDDW